VVAARALHPLRPASGPVGGVGSADHEVFGVDRAT